MAPTAVFPDFEPTVPALLRACRERHGDRDCVVTPTERLTFSELDERSRRLAARLVGLGALKGTRIAILFPNGPRWVVAWAAATRIGAVAVPVNTFYQQPELARFLRHSDAQMLMGVRSFLGHDYVEALHAVAPSLPREHSGVLHLPELPQLRQVLWDDQQSSGDVEDEDLAVAMGDDVYPGDPLLITYTSGSTGEPKGVVHSHGAAIRHARNLAALSGFDRTSRVWTPMPLCWVGGFEFGLLRAASVGGCFVTQEVFEAGEALDLIERERVTNLAAWPAVSKAMAEHPRFAKADLSALRGPASFYDALPKDRRPPDQGLSVSSLGMTETCGPHTFWWGKEEEVRGVPEAHRGAHGHEVPGIEHRVIDTATGADLPEGVEGEVLVRGYSLMLGLYKRERHEVFDADGWYHTGDRGYFRDGFFFFTGRQTDMIKTSGFNVAPDEVERCLLTVDGVKLAFVVGIPHPERGQDVVALLVPREGAQVEPGSVRQRLRAQLSSYKVPRHVLLIAEEEVPWLVSQKPDRHALAALAISRFANARHPPTMTAAE